MTKTDQKSPAASADDKQADRSPARKKDAGRNTQAKSDDMPGADGPQSAGASEDTYD